MLYKLYYRTDDAEISKKTASEDVIDMHVIIVM